MSHTIRRGTPPYAVFSNTFQVRFNFAQIAGGPAPSARHRMEGPRAQLARHAVGRRARAALPDPEQPTLHRHLAPRRGHLPGRLSAQAFDHSLLHRHPSQTVRMSKALVCLSHK